MNQSDKASTPQLNFAGLNEPFSNFDKARVVILPIPYDATSEWHKGSKFGPQAIIEASEFLELYDQELDVEIYKIGIHTLPAVRISDEHPETMIKSVYQTTSSLIKQSKFIISLGGEHTVSIGLAKAFSEHFENISVLHLDAHTDLRDEYNGTRFGQATVIRRILEFCPVTQVGIRSLSQEEKSFIDANKLHPYLVPETITTYALPVKDIVDSLNKNVYVTVDLDVFDPCFMPAVGLPEPGGLSWNDVTSLLRTVIDKKNIIGIDFVELCPDAGPASCAFLTAKLVYKIIGYQFS
jgi:agmatinase